MIWYRVCGRFISCPQFCSITNIVRIEPAGGGFMYKIWIPGTCGGGGWSNLGCNTIHERMSLAIIRGVDAWEDLDHTFRVSVDRKRNPAFEFALEKVRLAQKERIW